MSAVGGRSVDKALTARARNTPPTRVLIDRLSAQLVSVGLTRFGEIRSSNLLLDSSESPLSIRPAHFAHYHSATRSMTGPRVVAWRLTVR